MEMWWYESHSWNIGIEDYKPYRRVRQGRKGRYVTLCVKKFIDREDV